MAHYSTWPCRIYCERRLGAGLEQAAFSLLDFIPSALGRAPFAWDVGTERPTAVTVDAVSVARLLARARRTGVAFILGNAARSWDLLIAFQESPVEKLQYVDLSLPGPLEPQLADLEGMMSLVRGMATRFRAHVAYTEDAALALTFVRDRANRAALRNIPARVRAQLPKGSLANLEAGYEPIPGVAGDLPELRTPSEFPHDRVPSAVFWINWWTARQVEELGRERVRKAAWARVDEADDGSMTLAATPNPPDLGKLEDIARLRAIVEALELRKTQDRLRGAGALD